ncbi:unnamed protein product [Moneuplotes crassus]|uniref:Uncharacterized protein n=1 Tax=Euplotes crassus TaxID=5936 RepID=A0AAD1XWA9_EUPCR|nr:unnamed protein product [Moneuplotes crassus]
MMVYLFVLNSVDEGVLKLNGYIVQLSISTSLVFFVHNNILFICFPLIFKK